MKGQSGIYVSPHTTKGFASSSKELKLWMIKFKIKNGSNGYAIINACDSKEAENLLKANGIFHKNSHLYEILEVEEINTLPEPMLIMEHIE